DRAHGPPALLPAACPERGLRFAAACPPSRCRLQDATAMETGERELPAALQEEFTHGTVAPETIPAGCQRSAAALRLGPGRDPGPSTPTRRIPIPAPGEAGPQRGQAAGHLGAGEAG